MGYLVTAAVLASGLAHAQETGDQEGEERRLETVQVTGQLSGFGATKTTTPILETARSISVETEEQFRDKGAATLAAALDYTSGVDAGTYGAATRGDFAKIRGFDAAEYRDGQQVLFGYYNNTRTDIYMLEQVEALKGPASVLFGKGTPGGIVNAASKLAGPDKRSEVVFDIGSNERYQAAGDFNARLAKNVYFRLVGVYRDSGTQVDYVKDDAVIVMPSLTYDNGTTRLTAMVEVSDRDSDTSSQFLPLAATACLSDQVTVIGGNACAAAGPYELDASTYLGEPGFNRYDTNSTLFSLLGSHAFNENFSVDGIFRYKDGEADYRQSYPAFPGAGVPRMTPTGDTQRVFYWSDAGSEQTALDIRARYAFETGILDHEVFVGAAYQDVTTSNRYIYGVETDLFNVYNPVYDGYPAMFVDPANFYDPGDSTTEDHGIYISDQISVGAWKFNIGLRYDETETETATTTQKDDATSFSAGVLYAFDNGFSPYVSFAESFQPVIGLDGFTSEPLKPREGEQWEAGIKYQPPGTRTYLTLAYFEIEESNLPNPASIIGQPDSQQEGVGKVKGVEVEALTTLGAWYLEGNFSSLDTETPDGVPFASIAENQGSVWAQYQPEAGPLANFKAGFGLRYLGENESNGVGSAGLVRVVTDGVLLGDMLLGYETEKWDFTLNARNIADEDYYGTCLARGDCFPGERRSVVARIARRF